MNVDCYPYPEPTENTYFLFLYNYFKYVYYKYMYTEQKYFLIF